MRMVGVVFGLAAVALACGPENTQHSAREGAPNGGSAGAPSGGSNGNGGIAAAGGAAAEGGVISGPICPDQTPEAGSACDSTAINCRYDVCGDDTSEMFSCRQGQWVLTRACGTLTCPPERPLFLSDCAPLEGLGCSYVEDCCGTDPPTQTVVARCELSQWILMGPLDEACSFCEVHHEVGATCDLPSECSSAGCYWTSCYGQPLVEECVDGVWRSQTLCSK